MHEVAPIIKDLAIMLGIAGIVTVIFQKIRQPVILGYIIAGVIIGPHTPPYSLVTDITQIHTLSDLGVIFLMFALGLDFSFHKLKRIGFSATITGIIKVSAVMIAGFYIGQLIKWSFYDCLFLGAALSISSTTIIIKSLDELNLKGKRFTDVVFGILIIEDLLAVLILTSLATIATTNHIVALNTALSSLKVILVIGSWFLIGYFFIPLLFRKVIKHVSQETLTIISVALCLFLAVLAAHFHYSTALGAFIMGSILAETPLVNHIKQLTYPLRDIFAGVFFISIGMTIDLRTILEHWPTIFMLSLLTICGKTVATSFGAFLSGQSLRTSIRSGFSMASIGEFSFIIVSLGSLLKVTSSSLAQIIVGVAAITIFAAPYFIILSDKIVRTLDNSLSERSKYFLESYSAWVYRALANYKKQINYRRFAFRIAMNGIIIAIIFNITHSFILPYIRNLIFNTHFAQIFCWVITLLIAFPFVWGMFFSFKLIPKDRQLPALFLSVTLTTTELIALSIIHFRTWYIPLGVIIIATMFLGLIPKQIGLFYHWFEKYLLYMLRKRDQKRIKYEELAPWDTHLVKMLASNQSASDVIGKTLSDSQLRQRFGINVVAIRRRGNVILTPRGEERIMLQDELIVLGTDEQIDAFKKNIEDVNFNTRAENILDKFTLKALELNKDSPYINKSIRDSKIREHNFGLVVGLERNGFRISNPNPATIMKNNDLVLIIGLMSHQ